ncbi:MAG: FtsX-like permease family protein [Spirochaetales bacterium]|nr:FtsX-like permease family protein [Spirochaetales bacterium]
MPVTLRMAFRNLVEHKAKSLIVGVLLALGMLIMVVGNSFLDASKRGIESSFTENYTGDVIITGVADGPVSLFGVQSPGGLEQTPIIPDYEKVIAYASTLPGVTASAGMATGFGIATDENGNDFSGGPGGHPGMGDDAEEDEDDEGSMMDAVMLFFGIDAANYWQLFETIELVDGEFLKPGQAGMMVAADRLPKIGKYLKRDLKVGDEILIQGMGGAGMRLRTARIVGTFKRVSEGAGPEQLTYMDIDTLRVLAGMTVGAAEDIELGEAETGMLAVDDLDSLFGEDAFSAIDTEVAPSVTSALTEEGIDSLLGDTSERERLNTADTGAWHSILLRLENPAQARSVVAGLNAWFAAEGIEAAAGDWQKAAGPYAQSVDVLRIVFTVAIVILAVVAIIIIMNTMVVSIIERTGEIGTMRALGAGRMFVRKLFVAETVTLSIVFGLVGMALAFIVSAVINALGIEASNQFLEILFGGKILRTIIDPVALVWSLGVIVSVGIVAHFYPVSVALRIQPVTAMQA